MLRVLILSSPPLISHEALGDDVKVADLIGSGPVSRVGRSPP